MIGAQLSSDVERYKPPTQPVAHGAFRPHLAGERAPQRGNMLVVPSVAICNGGPPDA